MAANNGGEAMPKTPRDHSDNERAPGDPGRRHFAKRALIVLGASAILQSAGGALANTVAGPSATIKQKLMKQTDQPRMKTFKNKAR
jgi:hypothetical protein